MKYHTCEKCGKIFDHKHNYIYHTTKLKTSCSNIPNKVKEIQLPVVITPRYKIFPFDPEKNNCIYCNKSFHSKIYTTRHEKLFCKTQKSYATILEGLKEDLEYLKTENIELNEKYLKEKKKRTTPFGMEKISLTKVHILEAIDDPYNKIPQLIKHYHFDSSHPEFKNIQIKNPKDTYYEIYNGTEWKYELKKTIIDTLLQTYKDIIDTYYSKKKDKIDADKSKAYKEFTENIDMYITNLQQYKYSKNPTYKKIYQRINDMLIAVFGKKIL